MSDPATTGADEPGFLDRARLRRRLRHLEQAKEIGLRDVGGLMFELHRAGSSNDELVDGKLKELAVADEELLALRAALGQSSDVVELREAGIAACESCGEIIASDAKYCSRCGTATQDS